MVYKLGIRFWIFLPTVTVLKRRNLFYIANPSLTLSSWATICTELILPYRPSTPPTTFIPLGSFRPRLWNENLQQLKSDKFKMWPSTVELETTWKIHLGLHYVYGFRNLMPLKASAKTNYCMEYLSQCGNWEQTHAKQYPSKFPCYWCKLRASSI